MKTEIRDRLRRLLVDLAVGAAVDAAVKLQPSGTFTPVTAYRSCGPRPRSGEWTDDTSMALAESIAARD